MELIIELVWCHAWIRHWDIFVAWVHCKRDVSRRSFTLKEGLGNEG